MRHNLQTILQLITSPTINYDINNTYNNDPSYTNIKMLTILNKTITKRTFWCKFLAVFHIHFHDRFDSEKQTK